jgi:ubiquinone/menaquinone biosynthesis C-methylase UbiE
MATDSEEARLQQEYRARDERLPWNDRKTNVYHPRHPFGQLLREHQQALLVDALNSLALELAGLRILDVGCGYGAWLRCLVELGAAPEHCFGVDLSAHRLEIARQKNPSVVYQQQNVENLPFPDHSFGLVIQSVVLSSVQDAAMRTAIAREMFRVTQPAGIILWVDLVRSRSASLIAFSAQEVRDYFPEADVVYQRFAQPWYFRHINGRWAWLSKAMYALAPFGCEVQFMALRRGGSGQARSSTRVGAR